MIRIVLWVDTSSHVAAKVMNGGASIPQTVKHRPQQRADDLDKWFAEGWVVASATSHEG